MNRALAALALLFALALPAAAREEMTVYGERGLAVLSAEDVARYREIFALQAEGQFGKADAVIAQLESRVLIGHVLKNRYLHPAGGRTAFTPLANWMRDYADHPGAERIYRLALKRGGRNARLTPPLPRERLAGQGGEGPDEIALTGKAARIATRVRDLIRRDRPSQALAYLNQHPTRRQLSQAQYDVLRQRIAWSFFLEGKDAEAIALAGAAAAESRSAVPLVDWVMGLAHFRQGRLGEAGHHFELFSEASQTSWSRTAGAFWAARCYLLSRQPQKVTRLLERAAAYPETFYGLLALRLLGREPPFAWAPLALQTGDVMRLRRADPAVERALALAQLDELSLAEEELLRAAGRIDPREDEALAALSDALGLAGPLIAIANARGPSGKLMFGRYPLPKLAPASGYTLDRALVLGFVRAESRFDTFATSPAGARGLMQIKPATARHLTGTRDSDRLYDGAYNLALGQAYLQELMAWGEPAGNLFMLATAYNAGPGNLQTWLAQMDYRDDPLLYIESVPARETRIYIEHVIANVWIYHHRLQQKAPTLDAVASGDWPVYRAVERRR